MSTDAFPHLQAPSDVTDTDDIDREMRHGFWALTFEPELERAYVQQTHLAWDTYRTLLSIVGIVLFDCYLFDDWVLVPNTFTLAVVLRLCVVTPMALSSLFIARRLKSDDGFERINASVGVFVAVFTMIILLSGSGPNRTGYQYGNMLIILFIAVAQRLRFRYALAGTAGIVVVSLVSLSLSDIVDLPVFQSDVVFYFAGATLVLFASYTLERDHRRRFISALRGELLDRQLESCVNVDPLTGLWNRRFLMETMQAAWARAEVNPVRMAVLLLDVDRFKLFNDTYGHLEGDLCLERIGACLRDAIADETATLARYGGEEFLVFAQDIDETASLAVAERLLEAIRRQRIPHPALGDGAIVTASLGVAVAPIPATSSASLIAEADRALYRAKSDGRDRVALAPHGGRARAPSPAAGDRT